MEDALFEVTEAQKFDSNFAARLFLKKGHPAVDDTLSLVNGDAKWTLYSLATGDHAGSTEILCSLIPHQETPDLAPGMALTTAGSTRS